MNKELENSVEVADLEFKKVPMEDYYSNLVMGSLSRLRVNRITKELGDLKNKKVLDVGCEAGYVSLRILEKKPAVLCAIDICKEALETFKEKLKNKKFGTKIIIKNAFMQKIPFNDNFFDKVICTEVIEHTPKLDDGLKEIRRVMGEKAELIITFPNEKMRKKVYPIIKLFGINTDVENEVNLFEYNIKDIILRLKKFFKIKKVYTLPKLLPITYFIICEKE
jgi:ubiquinone/menaquinone biosynthesis C-methylase UbiE